MSDAVARINSALSERYQIERELGAGGMATVYLAADLRHGRKVAIKVLRPELAAAIGADRFVREIRTIAALQHPHILGLIDSGEVQGTAYFVMPYVDGESLRARLHREAQLPVADAVRITTEVASALDYAHRHGVIHRDIKPANILLHDGSALLADFGIALALTSLTGTRVTETGITLGTPHYMSPEQAMGEREITIRTDVYSLGAVLYEMLCGEPPFTGATAQAIVTRLVTEEPRPLAPLRRTIPPHIEAAVMTALEKLAADRFASAAEFAAALTDPGYRGSAVRATAEWGTAGARRPWLRRLPLAAAGVGALLLAAGLLATRRPPPTPAPVSRYRLAMPEGQEPLVHRRAMMSPDGGSLAYIIAIDSDTATDSDARPTQIWIKPRDDDAATPLAGTRGAWTFGWSPDGRSIAFTAGTQLKTVPVAGGGATTIADSASVFPGLAWLDDGTIVFPRQGGLQLGRVHATGGTVTRVLVDTTLLGWPSQVAGRAAVLHTRCARPCRGLVGGVLSADVQQDVWVLDLESGKSHRVIPNASKAWYVPTGHLVYARRDGSVFAAPFDRERLAVTGEPVSLLDGVLVYLGLAPLVWVSASGTLVMRDRPSPRPGGDMEMVWVDRSGRVSQVDPGWTVKFRERGSNFGWSLSPDGRRLAIGLSTPEGDDIWVKQLPRGPLSRVSYHRGSDFRPRWMPDGRLMYGSSRADSEDGRTGLYARRADGSGEDSVILRAGGLYEGDWSPDGRWLVFRTGGLVGAAGGRDIFGIRPGIDTAPVPLVATRYDEEAIAIARDGKWIAYESNETGRTEIFVRPFPDTDSGKWQISDGGGFGPLWSRDGRELFYMNAGRRMIAVSFGPGAGGTPDIGPQTTLFLLDDDIYMTDAEFYTPHDVAADGRFLMARSLAGPEGPVAEPATIIIENWFTELKERMGRH